VKGEKRGQEIADKVRKDLAKFGLLTSEKKCVWKVTQEMEWTGWIINTKSFKIFVPERKLLKAEQKLKQLLAQVGRTVKVKELSSMVGLLISFGLAECRSARFHTRFATMLVAKVAEEKGWGASLRLPREVGVELRFWQQNLRRLKCQTILKKAGVQVVHPMILCSDAGGHMARGYMIQNRKVCNNTVFQVDLSNE
jgi:hypothetical protein